LDCEDAPERDQDQTHKRSQPGDESAEVIADGGEDGVGGIAVVASEIAAAEMAVAVPSRGWLEMMVA
jgi:hypothetical protein